MEFLTLTVSGLNPDVEKFKYFNKYPKTETAVNIEQIQDKKDTYFLINSKIDIVKEHIISLFNSLDNDLKISSNVLRTGFLFLDSVYPSLIEELEIENVYSTPYGTLIMDWEKDEDNVFSLELGAEKIGYFIEQNGRDIMQIDEKKLEDSKLELLSSLSDFLSE